MAETVNSVLTYARVYGNTDNNGLTDSDGVVLANEALYDFRAWLIEQGAPAGDVAEVNKNATSAKGIYNWSSDLSITDFWMLKSFNVNYIDTTKANYIPVTQIDYDNLPAGASVNWLRQNQSKTQPLLYLQGNQFEIVPAPATLDNLTSFFNVFYFQAPGTYAGTTDAIAYPESLDDRVLSYRIAATHALRKGSTNYDALNKEYLKRANRILQIIRQGTQTPFQVGTLPLSGWEF